MPISANTAASRQDIDHASSRSAEMPRIRMPASEKRAVSRIIGGQSVTPILPATKAKLQSRQNSVMYSGSGLKPVRGTGIEGANDMRHLLSPHLGARLDIWKLNDRLTIS